MSGCDYLERHGVSALEDGGPPDAHVASCPECQRVKRLVERLPAGLQAAAARHEPPPEWEERVRGRIAERRRRPTWTPRLAAAALAAAAVLAAVAFWARSGPEGGGGFVVALDPPGTAVHRGADGPIGSRLRLDAPAAEPFVELRLYRDDTVLELRCSTEPPCRRRRGRVGASLVLTAIGSYQPVVLRSDRCRILRPRSTSTRRPR